MKCVIMQLCGFQGFIPSIPLEQGLKRCFTAASHGIDCSFPSIPLEQGLKLLIIKFFNYITKFVSQVFH